MKQKILKNTLGFLDVDRCNIKMGILAFVQNRPLGSKVEWWNGPSLSQSRYIVSGYSNGRKVLLTFKETE